MDIPPVIVLIGVTIAGQIAEIAGNFLETPMIANGREILVFVH